MASTLLHICCAPCSIRCIETLRAEGIEPVGYWYNPNIHPYTEYRSRKTTLEEYAKAIDLPLIINNEYGLRPFLHAVGEAFDDRCETCYRMRLNEVARTAAEKGFASFTTTLLISPYQDHELIVRVANEAAAAHGVTFLYRDFRPYFKEGQQIARDSGLYMQKYCGCIFSEEERYRRKKIAKSTV
ncbi:MAG: epoxyqueuosine reductase QueH [Clostridia bacterium]|nr:epoxyqueuosine reductase QueH [Clostridia bacterium]